MQIAKFQMKNHKSFEHTGMLDFQKGINIIVGKNNSGKTALLEALSLKFEPKPHINSRVKPRPSSTVVRDCEIEIFFRVEGNFLKDFALSGESYMGYPVNRAEIQGYRGQFPSDYIDHKLERPHVIRLKAVLNNTSFSWKGDSTPAIQIDDPEYADGNRRCTQLRFIRNQDRTGFTIQNPALHMLEVGSELGFLVAENLKNQIYKFSAERLKISAHRHANVTKLNPDASNLPQVLANLHMNRPNEYQQYVNYVKLVFPEVHYVGIRNNQNGDAEIYIRMEPGERDDLIFKITECGTGLSQVLAILYVACSEQQHSIIIIDEPNSFLHPGAIKTLMEILATFDRHQYIISSHSAEIFKNPKVTTLKLVTLNENRSQVKSLDLKAIDNMKESLLELGIEMSDILAADKTVWVEGPTEKQCFPAILRHQKGWSEHGTSFIAVKNTGDFDGKQATLVIDLYNRMNQGNLILPKKSIFIFDSEKKTKKEKEDLSRMDVNFIPRRMFENYLLVTEAIVACLSSFEHQDKKINDQHVQSWLTKNFIKYVDDKNIPFEYPLTSTYLLAADGAKLISDLFADMTDAKYTYNKIKHGIFLTDWILANRPEHFDELANYLKSAIG